jgi:hypothetical protein
MYELRGHRRSCLFRSTLCIVDDPAADQSTTLDCGLNIPPGTGLTVRERINKCYYVLQITFSHRTELRDQNKDEFYSSPEFRSKARTERRQWFFLTRVILDARVSALQRQLSFELDHTRMSYEGVILCKLRTSTRLVPAILLKLTTSSACMQLRS